MKEEEFQYWKKLRRHLHSIPELAWQEKMTTEIVYRELAKYQSGQIKRLNAGGLLWEWTSQNKGPRILFRAELDALPINEENDFDYKSIHEGNAHKCGHDGHMVMVLALAKYIENNPPNMGGVTLLFQPAEENGEGAGVLLKENPDLNCDFVFALHNVPGFKRGDIICKAGVFSASVSSLIVDLQGKTSHAAEPENGKNPASLISEILPYLETIQQKDPASDFFFLCTVVHINVGKSGALGVSAGKGRLELTMRAWELDVFEKKQKDILAEIERLCKKYELSYSHRWTEGFESNLNGETSVEMIKEAAEANNYTFVLKEVPFKWGEDFGHFTQTYPGAFFGLGAGENHAALHNPDYDFPDELIPIGSGVFKSIIYQMLNK
jgi:amidohydrolase